MDKIKVRIIEPLNMARYTDQPFVSPIMEFDSKIAEEMIARGDAELFEPTIHVKFIMTEHIIWTGDRKRSTSQSNNADPIQPFVELPLKLVVWMQGLYMAGLKDHPLKEVKNLGIKWNKGEECFAIPECWVLYGVDRSSLPDPLPSYLKLKNDITY